MAVSPERIAEIKKAVEGLSKEEQQEKLEDILTDEEKQELFGEQKCPFCLIGSGEIESKKVYEDDDCLAVLDINPANNGHVILFTKKHYPLMTMVEDSEAAHLFVVANKLCTVIYESMQAKGTNIFIANGAAAGQNSQHALINIIPREEKDGVVFGWKPKKQSEEDMEETAKKIFRLAKSISSKKKNPEIIKQIVRKEVTKEKLRIP